MNTPIAKYFMENTSTSTLDEFQAKLDAFSLGPEQVDEKVIFWKLEKSIF